MENLQPYNGNPPLMGHMFRSSYIPPVSHMASFTPCVPYSYQNVLTSSPSAATFYQEASYPWALSSNSNIYSPGVFQMPNVMYPNTNEPTTTNTANQLLTNNGSFGNNDYNSKQFSDLPTTATRKRPKQKNNINKTTLDSNYGVQVNKSKQAIEKSINDETKVDEHDSSYVSKDEELSCLICDMIFWTEDLLKNHLEGNKFSCRVCTAEFINHSDLKSHFLSHRTYRCIICKKVFFSQEDVFNHRKSSVSCTYNFECDICKKMLSSEASVRQHKQYVHEANSMVYNCVVCNKNFSLAFKLNSHQTQCHVVYENIECKECSASFLGPKKLKFHTKMSHLKKRETCPYTCSVCGKVFYLQKSLAKHERSHSEKKETVVCELCGKPYKGARGLYDHIRHYHKKISKLKCFKCNMKFKSRTVLRVHLLNVHKEKAQTIPAVCEICGKTLKNKEQLRSHVLIHSSERRFKCDVCSATFKQLVALRTHSRIHTNVCKYNCNDCGKSFRWKQTFDKHKNKCKTTQS